MMGKTHMAVGGAAGIGLALAFNLSPQISAAFVVASVVGSLIPDLDSFGSTGAHLFVKLSPVVGALFLLFLSPRNASLESRFLDACIVALFVALLPPLIATIFPHRGPTHSVLLWLLVLLAVSLLLSFGLVWALAFGLVSGIIVGGILPDAATHSGVPALWPVYRERVHILPDGYRVKTGGFIELFLIRPALLLLGLLLFLHLLKDQMPLLLRLPWLSHPF
ncbi:MAG: metal-dependent hydrolase [Blastocatellia bacterium]